MRPNVWYHAKGDGLRRLRNFRHACRSPRGENGPVTAPPCSTTAFGAPMRLRRDRSRESQREGAQHHAPRIGPRIPHMIASGMVHEVGRTQDEILDDRAETSAGGIVPCRWPDDAENVEDA